MPSAYSQAGSLGKVDVNLLIALSLKIPFTEQRGGVWGVLFCHSLLFLRLSPCRVLLQAPDLLSLTFPCLDFVLLLQNVLRLDTKEVPMPWLTSTQNI